jgi:hypothetical protein
MSDGGGARSPRGSLRLVAGNVTRSELESTRGRELYQTWLLTSPPELGESRGRVSMVSMIRRPSQKERSVIVCVRQGSVPIHLRLVANAGLCVTQASLEDVRLSIAAPVGGGAPDSPGSGAIERGSSCPDAQLGSPHMDAERVFADDGATSPSSRDRTVTWRYASTVPLQEGPTGEAPGSLWRGVLSVPASGVGAQWSSSGGRAAWGGEASLSCCLVLRLADGSVQREILLVHGLSRACAASRCVILAAGREGGWGVEAAYPVLLSGILHDVSTGAWSNEAYRALWWHGLVLAVMHKMRWAATRPLTAYACVSVLARHAGVIAQEGPPGRPCRILQLYGILGGVLLAFRSQGGYPDMVDFPPPVWGILPGHPRWKLVQPEVLPVLSAWVASCREGQSWGHGAQHLLRFMRAALLVLLGRDSAAVVPSFRSSIAVVPLLEALNAVDVFRSPLALANVCKPPVVESASAVLKAYRQQVEQRRRGGGEVGWPRPDLTRTGLERVQRTIYMEIMRYGDLLRSLETDLHLLGLPSPGPAPGYDHAEEAFHRALTVSGAFNSNVEVSLNLVYVKRSRRTLSF